MNREEDLQGFLPTQLGLLSKVTSLTIQDHSISGTLPTEIGLLTQLNSRLYATTSTTGHAVDHKTPPIVDRGLPALRRAASLCYGRRLKQNFISGSIPTQIGQLSSIESMCVHILECPSEGAIVILLCKAPFTTTRSSLTGICTATSSRGRSRPRSGC